MFNTGLSHLQQRTTSRACYSERLPSTLLPSVFIVPSVVYISDGFMDSIIKTSICFIGGSRVCSLCRE